MEKEKKDQVIERLVTALEFYADPQYWEKIWGVASADSERLWVGPGAGCELAQRALEDIKEKKMTYVCAVCQQTFEEDWTEEEALAELQENFGNYTPEECDIVCDDCYKKILSGVIND